MRRSLAVLTALTAALITFSLGTGPATAAGSHCGKACDGKDPATYLVPAPGGPSNYYYCNSDATTIAKLRGDGSHPAVELRYSPHCATAWARAPKTPGATYSIRVRSYYTNGKLRLTESGTTSGGEPWTPMINHQGLLARACVYIPYGSWVCTHKR